MRDERLEEKKSSRNGWQESAGSNLQTPVTCRPACRRHKISDRRGSQVIEYALVIAALAAAFTTMFVYGKRGLQGIIRTKIDRELYPSTQADGWQKAGFMGNDFSQSEFQTVSGEENRGSVTATGVVFDINTFSTSTGVTTSRTSTVSPT